MRRFIRTLTVLVALATAASFLDDLSWWLEIIANFRLHLAALALFALMLGLVWRRWTSVILCLACLLANASPIRAYLPATDTAAKGPPLRVMTLNLHQTDTHPGLFKLLIEREQPDILLLTALPADMAPLTQILTPTYPTILTERRGSAYDVLLASRWAVTLQRVDRNVAPTLPVLFADLCNPDEPLRCVTVIGLHGARPLGDGRTLRDAQFDVAAGFARRARYPVVLLGDLNASTWAQSFRRLEEGAGLRDAQRGQGVFATWTSSNPFLGLAIDHVLVSLPLAVISLRPAMDVGSDHLPLVARLAWRSP